MISLLQQGQAGRGGSENQRPPFPREFRGATSDNCHEKSFLLDEKLFLHDKKLHLVDEKLFLHDKKRHLIDEKLFLHDKKPRPIDEELHPIEPKRFLINQKPRRRCPRSATAAQDPRLGEHEECRRETEKQRSREDEESKMRRKTG